MWRFLLNLLLPQPPRIAQLEAMNAAEFRRVVPPLAFQPQEWVLALFPYEHPLVKTAVWEVKYRGNACVVRLAGTLLAEELLSWLAELAETEALVRPILIPIPLAKKRARERGFNQCELLAREVAQHLGNAIELRNDLLCKTKETASQTKSRSRTERLENLRGAFSVSSPHEVAGRTIVLLDDVTTTGATLTEARKTLRAAGARKVLAVSFAH